LKDATIKYLIRLLFILFSLSFAQFATAGCNVGGVSYNVGGTGLISSLGAGGAITRDIIITVDTAGGDISNCDVTGITDMSDLFYPDDFWLPGGGCPNGVDIYCDLSAQGVDQNLSTWDVSNVTNMSNMFRNANFTNGGLGSLVWSNTSSVTDMSRMFSWTHGLTSVSLLDTRNVENMASMFETNSIMYSPTLTSVSLPKTGNVINMSKMFKSSNKLTTVSLPEMGKVEDMSQMFFGASGLTSISLDDTSSVTDMSEMFSSTYIAYPFFNPFIDLPPVFAQDIRNFDVTSVSNFDDMFKNATGMISKFGATANWNTTPTSAWFVPDTVAPTLSSSSPADNAIGVAVDTDITLTFTENIIAGTGNISLYDSDDNLIQAFDVASDVTLSGTTATLNPTDNLIISKRYYIQIAATAIDDAGDANSYAGILDKTSLNFTPMTDASIPTPSAAFAGVKADVESKMAANARTQLNDFTTSTSSIVGSARSRFMNTSGVADSSDTALSGDVSSDSSDLKGSTKRVNSTADGKATSIIEVQYQYTETKEGLKSQNASGQIINEAKLSDSLTFGRFLGVTLGDGDAVGTNNIDIDFMGAQAGAYLVGNTKGGLVYDTYFAGSVIENKMGVTTSLMTADSKYYSSMLTTGASITGTLQVKKVEIRPTLSTDFSYMFRETADFDVKVGSATSVEQAAYGDIAKAQITFAPEFRLPFGEGSVITATPNVMCRYLKQSTATEDCGQGLSLGFRSTSKDGFTSITAKAGMDRIGSETTSSLRLQFEQKL
jgi:methionine-rich copper-binding protein CopC